MADGRTHFISNVIMGIGVALLVHRNMPSATPYVITGLTIATIITPDMDLEGTTYTERAVRKIPLIGTIWQVQWYLYTLWWRHRGYSHNLFLGTIGRAFWLIGIIIFAIIVYSGFVHVILNELFLLNIVLPNISYFIGKNVAYINCILLIIIGWYLNDWNHYLLDIIFSERKRRRKKNK